MTNIKVNIICSSRYKINRKFLKETLSESLSKIGINTGVVNLTIVGKTKMKQLSQAYKNENVALPILTFPYFQQQDQEYLIAEIVICYPQAILLAAERNKTVDNLFKSLIEHSVQTLNQQLSN
ncbi:MAG: hypothetical protein KatS3mg090_0391 [Patescibacteria group bacterium]|nr:MAG: hypothetical protein KatS3mg090_0391 [Patescibacteria group bacterium]